VYVMDVTLACQAREGDQMMATFQVGPLLFPPTGQVLVRMGSAVNKASAVTYCSPAMPDLPFMPTYK
jgi:hypothetical protein